MSKLKDLEDRYDEVVTEINDLESELIDLKEAIEELKGGEEGE